MLQHCQPLSYCCEETDNSTACHRWPARPESPATLILRELEQERERKRRLEWFLEEVMQEKKLLTEESMARSSYFAMVGFPDDAPSFAQASSFSYLPRGRSSTATTNTTTTPTTTPTRQPRAIDGRSNKRARREPQPEFGSWSGSSSVPSSPATFGQSFITQTVEEVSTTLSWTQSCINSNTYSSSSPIDCGSVSSVSSPALSYSFLGSLNSNQIDSGSWESPLTTSEGEGEDIKELQKLLETSEEDVDFFSCFRTINEGRQWLATTSASTRPTC